MPTPSPPPDLGKLTRARVALIIAVVLAILAGGSVALVVDSDPSPPTSPTTPQVVTVPTKDAGGDAAPVTTPADAVKQAEAGQEGEDDHSGSRSEQPEGVSAAELDAGREQQERFAQRDDLPAVTPDAAPSQAGCTTRLVRNFSSRRGVRPRLFVLHYTVSPNRPAFQDVWGITSLFDRASFAASSNYVIDADGNCGYIVRESDKAWTQAGLNPVSISVEIIATGREGRLAGPAGIAKIGRVASDAMRRWDIPLQVGKVSGCSVVRSGLIDHKALGPCGGGHVDVSPYTIAPVLAAAKQARGSAGSSAKARGKLCNQLRYHRAKAKADGWTPKRVKLVTTYKARAKSLGLDETKCRA